MIRIKTPDEIEKMRIAGGVVARTLDHLARSIVPGKTTTQDLTALAEHLLAQAGAAASFKGYRGYPSAICASVNQVVVHGIPGPLPLDTGDIVGIDLGAIVEGYHGDAAVTVPVGEISEEAGRLLRVTREALYKGIEQARPGRRVGDIGAAIQEYAERHGYSVVRDLVGHGIGRSMHEDPQVPNFGKHGHGPRLREGMTLAIEPMVNIGGYSTRTLDDHWTIVTKDGSLSAHFEHTVAITARGPDILTVGPDRGGISANG
ncbi:MAG: type I methionyl aminopeptidase [Armatimonadota bacterium]|nr:type I methionyl aminopeptidase [Armatimonadota bacterium]